MQARTAGKPGRVVPQSAPVSNAVSTDRLREHIAELLLEAGSFVALARVEETAGGWLARSEPVFADPARDMLLVADALGMAMDLALFTPAASGATAFDRLERRRGRLSADMAGQAAGEPADGATCRQGCLSAADAPAANTLPLRLFVTEAAPAA